MELASAEGGEVREPGAGKGGRADEKAPFGPYVNTRQLVKAADAMRSGLSSRCPATEANRLPHCPAFAFSERTTFGCGLPVSALGASSRGKTVDTKPNSLNVEPHHGPQRFAPPGLKFSSHSLEKE
jgi:hypothetical protein